MRFEKNYESLSEMLQRNLMCTAHQKGFINDVLSSVLGKEPSTYRKYYYVEREMPLASFLGVVVETKAIETVSLLARSINCVVIPLPRALSEDEEYFKKASVILQETGEVMSVIGASLADGVYTRAEKKETIDQIQDAVKALVELQEALKKDLKAGEDE